MESYTGTLPRDEITVVMLGNRLSCLKLLTTHDYTYSKVQKIIDR